MLTLLVLVLSHSLIIVLERLDGIERDFLDLEASMATSEVLEDQNKLREVSRKYKQMTPLVE